jgi:hypothetical protein
MGSSNTQIKNSVKSLTNKMEQIENRVSGFEDKGTQAKGIENIFNTVIAENGPNLEKERFI